NLIDQGGAARVTGAHLRLEHSKISGNQTFVNVRDPYDFGNGGLGGGVAAMRGSMTIVDSEISGNTTHGNYLCAGGGVAIWYGSGLEIRRSTISGNEARCGGPFGAAVYAIGDYPNHVPDTLTIDRSTIADNHAFGDFAYGGGISAFAESVTITGSIVTGNTIDAGTGVYGYARAGGVNVQNRDVPADTRIEDTLIAGNRVEGRFAFAGGVRVGGGTFELVASTVAGNVVDGIDRARAGGVMTEMNRATVIDSTISGNKAAGLPDVTAGGGVMVLTEPDEPADFQSINSTIAGNDATPGIAGGVFFKRDDVEADSPTALFESSIVAGNVSAQGADEIDVADETLTAPVVIAAHSLLQGAVDVGPGVFEPDSVTVALFGSDPLLQPLADNGGPTPTQALPCGSPAINQGTNTLDLRFDQRGRGFPRKTGHRVDIGAVETRCPH
ncbi:MAG TPA: right-handed parallel beta-helix repeat-containing protein, partial [Rhodanobacteraceae bacterium]|nr:right-handed parallel beta-helix repeat-containing protein [Rhodanobacteraceae bacterium]